MRIRGVKASLPSNIFRLPKEFGSTALSRGTISPHLQSCITSAFRGRYLFV